MDTRAAEGSITIQPLITLLQDCLVRIAISEESGTGFFVAPHSILTCAHVVHLVQTEASVLIYWQGSEYTAQIEQTIPAPYPDLALLKVKEIGEDHPCVLLEEEVQFHDTLSSYGFPDSYPDGSPSGFLCEGLTGGKAPLLTFSGREVRRGFSGSPLLNLRTGGVCAMIRLTRGEGTLMGGRAIPVSTILQHLPTLAEEQRQFHAQDRRWSTICKALKERQDHEESVLAEQELAHLDPFPPVWNVPYRYSFFFTGREQVIEQLFTTFTSKHYSGTAPVQALSGLGGLGKTQTAVQYAYRYRQQYRVVLWMEAETERELLASFKTAAELLKRPATHTQNTQSLLASMQEWFQNTPDWLLIFDNADNVRLVEPFLPRSASGHLLLTTRATAVGPLAQPLSLMPLNPDDGALCILRRANYTLPNGRPINQLSDASPASVKTARELSYLMDGLPLALEQAGAYIETTGRSVSSYLGLYQHYRPEIQREQHGPVPTYREPVAFAWNIAREVIQNENPTAIELLYLCAFLDSNGIPYDILPKERICWDHLWGQ